MRSSFRPLALRAAHIIVAFTMLAVPTEALAFSGSAGSAAITATRSLPVRVTPRAVALGTAVRVAGRLPVSAAGTTVELQSARSSRGPWRRVRRTRVGDRGGFTLRLAPRHSALLRAISLAGASRVAPAAVAPGPRRRAAAAAAAAHRVSARPARVEVRASLRVARGARGAIAGQPVSVAGHLLPGRRGRTVWLQRRARRAWHTVARARTGARGGFAVRFRAPAGEGGGLRVVFAGDRVNARATAAAGTLAVYEPVLVSWYEDGGTTACGFHATYGIANRSLPCGTKVLLRHGARTVTATVDDRGPYVWGRDYDLNQTTAAALGFSGVGTIDASVR